MLRKYNTKINIFTTLALTCFTGGMLHAQLPAFPGAEGFGRYATGGRSGSVYIVTNLNNAGPGSLRDAVSQPNRIVVFEVGGVIKITSRIVVSPNVTIAGQTAPGGGITVYGNGVSFSGASNSICRYVRFRMGKSGDSGKDALGIANGNNMIFDHISVSWGRDENFSISGENPANITIQNSIIGQGLWSHSCGGLIQTDSGVSLYRNLYIDNQTRNPKVKGKNEFVNNIVYNWGGGGGYILGDSGGESFANIINNYFIKGPYTTIAPFTRGNLNFKAYCSDNYYDSARDGNLNGYVLTQTDYGVGADSIEWMPAPFVYPLQPGSPAVIPAVSLYASMVNSVGGSYPKRDAADSLMIAALSTLGISGNPINTFTDETTLLPGGTGIVFNAPPRLDTDRDGIPDAWETLHSLNPASAADGNTVTASGYTNLELYINDVMNTPAPAFVYHPTNFTDTVISHAQLNLSWTDNTGDETAFILERSEDNSTFSVIAVLAPNTLTYADTGLNANDDYYYRIKTATAGDTSAYTSVITAHTPPVPGYPTVAVGPTPVHMAPYVSTEAITLKWQGSDSASMFHVYMGTHPDSLFLLLDTVSRSVPLDPLQYNRDYYWRVDATGSIGTTTGTVWSFHTKNYFAPGITGYWKLDESTGLTATDNSSYGNDGEVSNNNSFTWQQGKINNAINLNPSVAETESAVIIPNDEVLMNNDNSFSISMWIKGPATTPNCYLIHKGSFAESVTAGTTGKWWGIERNGTNFRWAVDNNITKTTLTANNGSTAFFNDTWVHIVAIRSMADRRLRLYVNGVLNKAVDDNTVGDIGEPSALILGNSNDLNLPYKAMMDEVQLYNYALSEPQVLALYNSQTALPVSFIDVIASWKETDAHISWEVGLELKAKEYRIERSENGAVFMPIGAVPATQRSFYSFSDNQPLQRSGFYRIKAIDSDGKVTLSKIVQLNRNLANTLAVVVPNPVAGRQVHIRWKKPDTGMIYARIYDAAGRLTGQYAISNGNKQFETTIQLPAATPPGIYSLLLLAGQDKQTLQIVVP